MIVDHLVQQRFRCLFMFFSFNFFRESIMTTYGWTPNPYPSIKKVTIQSVICL